ncbi:egt [Pieris rapae granulovirus Wuhan]|uniref:Ecdysteroid UDP-glucosyltransferase n=1 Tax=Pieris rapae granulovirus Wuhan TaxID=2848030 RepID=D2J4T6_9BBAC|nr:egt [Betabaculovirus arrapae]ACZ63605.1 egt [Betabaculovirus arrapae]UOS85793.1 egt [Pieris rapae granulovirus]
MFFVVLLSCCLSIVQGSNILCVFPTPAFSHQTVFAAYVDKLATAGHNVTVITPMPRNVKHITEIGCKLSVQYFTSLVKNSTMIKQRGVVADENTVTADNYIPLVDMVVEQFKSENVTKLLTNKDNHFDLVVCEAFLSINLIFGYLYRAPVIRISSGYGTNENFETMNTGVVYNFTKHPNMWRSKFYVHNEHKAKMLEQKLAGEWAVLEQTQEQRLKQLFGDNIPSMSQLKEKVLMLFINVASVYDNNRAVGDNVQYLGGLHLKKPQPITDIELSMFLNNIDVVIYVSFGSIMDVSAMDQNMLSELVRVFNSLPYNVLWRAPDTIRTRFNLSSSVLTRNWFPQRDILNHPNVKLFVTQGGVQSMDEAIDSEVPTLGLAMAGDQFYNVHKTVQLGIGKSVNILKLEKERLDKKIVHMINNDRYTKRLRDLKKYIRSTTVDPLRKALWHTNRVLKNSNLMYLFNK